MISLKLNTDEFPELQKIKKTELKNKIIDIFQLGYNLMYPEMNSENNLILSKLNQLTSNTPQISDLNRSITQLLGLTNNSSKKGEMVEGIVEEYLKKKYSEKSYIVKRSEPHCGDGWLNLPNKTTVMVEVKAYSKVVNETEVEKLRYDMKYNNIKLGLMVSLGTKIQNSNTIDLELFNYNNKTFYIVKLGPIFNNLDLLETGLNLVEKLSNLEINNSKKIILENNLLEKTSLLLEKINQNNKLRESFNEMSLEIYQKMDNFSKNMTLLFLEEEQLLKQIITEINENSIQEIKIENKNLNLEKFSKYKIYPELLKLINLINNRIEFNIKKDKLLSPKLEIKITQEKLGLNFIDLNLNISLTCKNSDIKKNKENYKLIDKII